MQGLSSVAYDVLASQEGLCFRELVRSSYSHVNQPHANLKSVVCGSTHKIIFPVTHTFNSTKFVFLLLHLGNTIL